MTPTETEAALELFGEWAGIHDPGDAAAFADLCERHPRLAAALEAQRADWIAGARAVRLDSEALRLEMQRTRLIAGTDLDEALTASPLDDPLVGPLLRPLAESGGAIGRYRVGARLASGGMGDVYLAEDLVVGRVVAMKMLRPLRERQGAHAAIYRRARLLRFRREIDLLARLGHPGIVRLLDVGFDDDGRPWFTMPLVKGDDLTAALHAARAGQGGWTVPRALEVLARICETVASAHAVGIVHRDLKPANVRVGEHGEVVVLDWGLSKLLDGPLGEVDAGVEEHPVAPERDTPGLTGLLTRDGAFIGTPAYMAPEQARGGSGVPADVYAVGAMLFELLAGRPPNSESGRDGPGRDGGSARRGSLARLAPDVPLELVSIAERSLSIDPAQRYPTLTALAADLRRYLEGRVVAAHPVGLPGMVRKWAARNPAAAWLGGGAVAVAVVAGALLAISNARLQLSQQESAERLAAYRQLADVPRVEELLSEIEAPERDDSAHAAALRQWKDRAEQVLGRRPALQLEADRLAALASTTSGPDAEPEREVERFEAQFRSDRLGELFALLDRLAAALADVDRRIAFADTVRSLSIEQTSEAWRAARAAVASSSRYAGLDLPPQLGLLPLGADPDSGLWEFALLGSGRVPDRGTDRRLVYADDSAAVLVLLPAGRFRMGSEVPGPGRPASEPNVSLWARTDEVPVFEASVEAFFIGKHEFTQAQWAAAFRERPSVHDASLLRASTERHPVESVRAGHIEARLPRYGLRLPTESEWEYAARAGTSSDWWCGDMPASLTGKANLADSAVLLSDAEVSASGELLPEPDGYHWHSPVDRYPPNPFGLHDVIGNVSELTSGHWLPYPEPDAEPTGNFRERCIVRGGSFRTGPAFSRSAYRDVISRREEGGNAWGVRVARGVER